MRKVENVEDENGNIDKLMTENEIQELKDTMLNGIEDYLDYKNMEI